MENSLLNQILTIGETFFKAESDPTQIPLTKDATEKILSLSQKAILCKFDDNKALMGWVTVIPTYKQLAEKFLSGEITERQLLEETLPNTHYDALYLCAAFILPEHRGKGHAFSMLTEVISTAPCPSDAFLFAWPYSEEGRQLVQRMEQTTGRKVHLRMLV